MDDDERGDETCRRVLAVVRAMRNERAVEAMPPIRRSAVWDRAVLDGLVPVVPRRDWYRPGQ